MRHSHHVIARVLQLALIVLFATSACGQDAGARSAEAVQGHRFRNDLADKEDAASALYSGADGTESYQPQASRGLLQVRHIGSRPNRELVLYLGDGRTSGHQ